MERINKEIRYRGLLDYRMRCVGEFTEGKTAMIEKKIPVIKVIFNFRKLHT
jgi:hypothetical protein